MKLALIADVHGNLPALRAVLSDAAQQGVEQYAFLGDYCIGLPYANEVLDTIRGLPGAYVVSGNEDEDFRHWRDTPPESWPDGQFEAGPWVWRHMTAQNRHYVCGLPTELVVAPDGALPVRLFHKPEQYFAGAAPLALTPSRLAADVDAGKLLPEDFPRHAASVLAGDTALQGRLAALPAGVYAFGHMHLQWAHRQGNTLLVNPGACGEPLDFKPGAPYAVLEWSGGAWQCALRRVAYDIEAAQKAMGSTACARELPVWYSLAARAVATAREQNIPFLVFAEKFAAARGDAVRPFTRETWYAAFAAWQKNW